MAINRSGGFHDHLIRQLEPFNATLAHLLFAIAARKRRKEADLQLFASCRQVSREQAAGSREQGAGNGTQHTHARTHTQRDTHTHAHAKTNRHTLTHKSKKAHTQARMQVGEVEILEHEGEGEGEETMIGGKIVTPLVEPVAFQELFFSINSREDFMILGE